MTAQKTSAVSMIWPTTLAGILGAVVLTFVVLAGPADADNARPTFSVSHNVVR